jgi:hypothetical protein
MSQINSVYKTAFRSVNILILFLPIFLGPQSSIYSLDFLNKLYESKQSSHFHCVPNAPVDLICHDSIKALSVTVGSSFQSPFTCSLIRVNHSPQLVLSSSLSLSDANHSPQLVLLSSLSPVGANHSPQSVLSSSLSLSGENHSPQLVILSSLSPIGANHSPQLVLSSSLSLSDANHSPQLVLSSSLSLSMQIILLS